MKCYVINGEYDTVYEGSVVKVTSDGATEYKADIKNTYVYDEVRKMWEKHDGANLNQQTAIERNKYRENVLEFPNALIAENACKQKMR